MLASITPLGERARHYRWGLTAGIYILGTTAGGAAIGTATSLLGLLVLDGVPQSLRLGAIAAVLAAGFAWELIRRDLPGPQRQVDERWLVRYRRWVYASGYGVQLGAGIFTIVVSSSVYAIWVASFAAGRPGLGAVIGACAGAMRGSSILASVRVVSTERLVSLHRYLMAGERATRQLALAAQVGLAATAALVAASA
jgi:hypothetical protein